MRPSMKLLIVIVFVILFAIALWHILPALVVSESQPGKSFLSIIVELFKGILTFP